MSEENLEKPEKPEKPRAHAYAPSVAPRSSEPLAKSVAEEKSAESAPAPAEPPAGPPPLRGGGSTSRSTGPLTYPGSVPGLEAKIDAKIDAKLAEREAEGAASSTGPVFGIDRGAGLPERLTHASTSALYTRRARVEARIFEIAFPIGRAALELDRIRSTKQVDIERVLKKLDRVDDDISDLEKTVERPEGILGGLKSEVGRLGDRIVVRELREKRDRLTAELGLALLAADRRQIGRRTPDVADFLAKHAHEAKQVDELFIQSRLVDDELARRERDGRLDKAPKALERLAAKTGEALGDATDAATDKLKDLGKTAAKAALKQGGKAIMGLAQGGFEIGKERLLGDGEDEGSDERPARRERERDRDRKRDRDRDDDRAASSSSDDISERLRELARLHAEGVLTDAEFAKKKAKLLDLL